MDWLPIAAAIGGGTGLGAVLKAVFDAKSNAVSTTYTQLNSLVDQLQEDRASDRKELAESRSEVKGLVVKVDSVLQHLSIEREYSADLYAWGIAGAPPPPPQRRLFTQPLTP